MFRPVARIRTAAVLLGAVLALQMTSDVARAETAWVRGEVRLNLRTGPGTQYRIVGVMVTGDRVRILQRGDNWTQIRLEDGKEGWIPEGYLDAAPPPLVRLEQLENQVTELEGQLQSTSAEAARLKDENESLAGRDGDQRAEIEQLSMEVLELRAGARWPEWITGASILAAGMLVGAILHRNATRRPSSRIRI